MSFGSWFSSTGRISSAEIPTGASVTLGGKSWGVCSPPREPCGLQPCGSNGTASSAARPPLLELRRPHLEEWQVSGPLLSVCPNTEERGAAVSSWGQRGPLRGSQTAALNRRGSFAPSTVTPRTSAAPRTAPHWVSASLGLDQGEFSAVFSLLAQLELFSWAGTSQKCSCASLFL